MKFLTLFFILMFAAYTLRAQGQDHGGTEDHEHGHDFEAGFGAGAGYILTEKEFAPAFHMHILKTIGERKKFSAGPGVELFMDDHKHASFVLSLGYRPYHPVYIGISPGFSIPLEKEPGNRSGISFSNHFELLYEFELEHFHFGPLVEYSAGSADSHLLLALHAGIHF